MTQYIGILTIRPKIILQEERWCVMSKDSISRTLSAHQQHELLGALERAGLTAAKAQKVVSSKDNQLAKSIVEHIRGSKRPARKTVPAVPAAMIMGANFHGPRDVARCFGVRFTAPQISHLRHIPYSADTLTECAQTHVLVAGYPLTITEIGERNTHLLGHTLLPDSDRDTFSNPQRVLTGWHLVRKSALPGSYDSDWQQQLMLADSINYIPPACLVVYTAMLHARVRGEMIFQQDWIRSSTKWNDDNCVAVRGDGCTLLVYPWHTGSSAYVGIAVARKPDTGQTTGDK